jgi:hypothetical protein
MMAVNAVVADPSALGEIPIADHAAMRTVLIVTELWTMALGTQRHHIGKR